MKKIVLAVAAVLTVLPTDGAGATDTRTLAEFILLCHTSPRVCDANLEDYLRASRIKVRLPSARLSLKMP